MLEHRGNTTGLQTCTACSRSAQKHMRTLLPIQSCLYAGRGDKPHGWTPTQTQMYDHLISRSFGRRMALQRFDVPCVIVQSSQRKTSTCLFYPRGAQRYRLERARLGRISYGVDYSICDRFEGHYHACIGFDVADVVRGSSTTVVYRAPFPSMKLPRQIHADKERLKHAPRACRQSASTAP